MHLLKECTPGSGLRTPGHRRRTSRTSSYCPGRGSRARTCPGTRTACSSATAPARRASCAPSQPAVKDLEIYAIVHPAESFVWRQAQTSCFMRVVATCSPDARRLRFFTHVYGARSPNNKSAAAHARLLRTYDICSLRTGHRLSGPGGSPVSANWDCTGREHFLVMQQPTHWEWFSCGCWGTMHCANRHFMKLP